MRKCATLNSQIPTSSTITVNFNFKSFRTKIKMLPKKRMGFLMSARKPSLFLQMEVLTNSGSKEATLIRSDYCLMCALLEEISTGLTTFQVNRFFLEKYRIRLASKMSNRGVLTVLNWPIPTCKWVISLKPNTACCLPMQFCPLKNRILWRLHKQRHKCTYVLANSTPKNLSFRCLISKIAKKWFPLWLTTKILASKGLKRGFLGPNW